MDRIQLDYAFLYQCYDVLEALGLCVKRIESKTEPKPENGWLAWSFGAANELGIPQRWSNQFNHIKDAAINGQPLKEVE